MVAGVVLVPTGALPLKLVRRTERAVIERALSAPTPFTRLIAVVSRWRHCTTVTSVLGLHGTLRQQLYLPLCSATTAFNPSILCALPRIWSWVEGLT